MRRFKEIVVGLLLALVVLVSIPVQASAETTPPTFAGNQLGVGMLPLYRTLIQDAYGLRTVKIATEDTVRCTFWVADAGGTEDYDRLYPIHSAGHASFDTMITIWPSESPRTFVMPAGVMLKGIFFTQGDASVEGW